MDYQTDHRRHPRYDIPLEGTLHSRGETMPCWLRNISAGGALIKVGANLRPGQYVSVEIPEIGEMAGRVVRVNWYGTGISLEEGKAVVDAFLVEWIERQSKDT
ncbi:MAG: PilZ domain-containing protein [Proteobacteria bacterium]|nr:PilZ domain-containing protein [Pseudomonadota bacterium]